MRHFLLPVDGPQLVESVNRRTQASVDAEYLVLDQRSQGEVVKDVSAVPPDARGAVLPATLVVKPVYLRDLPRLVVPSDQCHPVRVAHLQGQKKEESLHRIVAPVHEIAKEEVVLVWTVSALLEELQQIVKLAVDVPADLVSKIYDHRRVYALDVALFHQDLLRHAAEIFHLVFCYNVTVLQLLDVLV